MINKVRALAVCAFAAVVITPAAQATTFPVGSPRFQLTNGTSPESPIITARFGNSYANPTPSFDDSFVFTIPQDGFGSGSISTSFVNASNMLVLTGLFINDVQYALTNTAAGQAATVNGLQIFNGVQNTIRVTGYSNGANGYSGTVTFAANSAVPEPVTWAMFIGGFGLIGGAMRKSRRQKLQVSFG